MSPDRPIFIGGLDRCGKTPLRLMLDAHPDLAMSRNAGLWTRVHGRYGDLLVDANARRLARELRRRPAVAAMLTDPQRFERDLLDGERSYRAAFALIGEQYAAARGASRWGDQTADLERHTDAIFATFPQACVIQMLRDPRDRFLQLGPSQQRRGGIGAATAAWLESARLATHNTQRYGTRYRVVRFEDLVADPEATMREVCSFIGEAYDLAMSEAAQSGLALARGGVGARLVAMDRRDAAFVLRHAHHLLQAHGYEANPVQLSSGERLRYAAIDTPLNSLRMVAWRFRHAAPRRPQGAEATAA